jgi:peptide/nickel transport system substrate-binding protein
MAVVQSDSEAMSRLRGVAQRSRRLRLALLAGAIMATLACLAEGAATGAVAAKPVLIISSLGANNSVSIGGDPAKGAGAAEAPSLEGEGILVQNADGSVHAGLATSWKYIPDPNGKHKSFQFTLRQDARYSDGARVTAQSVKAFLLYIQAAKTRSDTLIGPIRSIETKGKWTVVVHLKSPNPLLPQAFSDQSAYGVPFGPKALADPASLAKQGDFAGAYIVDTTHSVVGPGGHITLVPNPLYYDKSKQVWSKVVINTFATATSQLSAVETGQTDFVAGSPDTVDQARAAGVKVVQYSSGAFGQAFGFDFDNKIGPLADVRVRQALNYAVDRKKITNAVFGTHADPTSQWATGDSINPKVNNYYSYNPTKAKSLLAAAGYANGFTLTVLNLTFPTFDPMTEAICQYLKAVGVTCDIFTDNGSTWVPNYLSGKYAAVTYGSRGPFGPVGMWVWYGIFLKPHGILNPSDWHDPVLDKLYQQGSRSDSPTKYWLQMTARTTEQADFLPVSAPQGYYYISKHLGGVKATANGVSSAIDWYPVK